MKSPAGFVLYLLKSFHICPLVLCVAGALLFSGCRQAEQKVSRQNPLFEGWYADPEATAFDSLWWIYPTYSDVFDRQVFMDAFSSPDLVSWTRHERIIDTASVTWARRAMWAPAIVRKGDKYFLFFSANDVHEGEVGGIGVAGADSPAGPFKDLLGKPLLGEIVNGAQPIDQFVFKYNDEYYMVYGGWRHCNIARLRDDFTGFVPFEDGTLFREITPEGYVEGPVIFERNGLWYFMWSEGDWVGPDYRVAYATGNSPFGPFSKQGVVLQQDTSIATGAGHHSVLRNPGTDEWFIVYHRRPAGETDANFRVTCIDHLRFDDSGKILPVKITDEGVGRRKVGATQ